MLIGDRRTAAFFLFVSLVPFHSSAQDQDEDQLRCLCEITWKWHDTWTDKEIFKNTYSIETRLDPWARKLEEEGQRFNVNEPEIKKTQACILACVEDARTFLSSVTNPVVERARNAPHKHKDFSEWTHVESKHKTSTQKTPKFVFDACTEPWQIDREFRDPLTSDKTFKLRRC